MNNIKPARPVHPGKILWEEIIARQDQLSPDFLGDLELAPIQFWQIVDHQYPISAQLAGRIAKMFGTSVDLWLNLQRNWDAATDDGSLSSLGQRYRSLP